MSYLEELLPEFRKGAKIRSVEWSKGKYIHIPNPKLGDVLDETGKVITIPFRYIIENFWEFYKEPELDWDSIIKNKCPCWFWDADFKDRVLGLLYSIDQANTKFPYYRGHNDWWCHCQPVNKDEVTFFSEITK